MHFSLLYILSGAHERLKWGPVGSSWALDTDVFLLLEMAVIKSLKHCRVSLPLIK